MHDPALSATWTSVRRTGDKPALYDELATELDALLSGETDPVANAANAASAIYHALPELNWVGLCVNLQSYFPPFFAA